MIGAITFYSMRGSLSSGEYPLLSNGQDLTSYRITQFPRVKYRDGMQVSAEVPAFSGIENANVAEIGGRFYWVTEFRQKTAESNQYTVTLDYMGPTSLIKRGQSISAYLERSPIYLTKYLHDDFTNGQTEPYDIKQVGNIANNPDYWVYWVQITGMVNVGGNDLTQRYGCFVGFPKNSSSYIWSRLWASNSAQYPGVVDIINNVSLITPFVPSQITDISISKRCPYAISTRLGTYGYITCLTDADGSAITADAYGSGPLVTYYLDSLINQGTVQQATQTITFSLNDYARMCGTISLRDKDKNKVCTFPVQQGGTFTVWTVGDYSGISTIIDNGYQRAVISEGKLPWNSDTWSEYRAYDMNIDRQVAINAMQYAAYDRETQDIGGGVSQFGNAISGMIFGGIAGKGSGAIAGGVGGAMGMWASGYMNERAYDLSIMQAQDNLRLSQMRAKNTRGTAYNSGYGLIYAELTGIENDLILGIDAPMTNGSQLMSDYVSRHGYPCEGLVTISAQNGYYKGMMPSDNTNKGMYFDQFNITLGQGFKFVSP